MKRPQDVEDARVQQLERELQEMAQASSGAESFLATLASALFPGHEPDLNQVTWPERNEARGPAQPESAEARLKAAETRFRTLVEQIPAVTFAAVLGEGKNEIYVSPHIEQMLGFSQQEWLEAPFLWYWQLHPDDRELWNREFTRGLQTGGPFRAECRFFARDGRVVWVHGEARLVKDELGRPMLLQGVAFDITESKRAQELLLQEATRKAKVEEELAIARRVQTSLLPKAPQVEGLELSAIMRPAEEVGGDYYDVLPFAGGAWLAVGDVSGHGLDSGLVMLMVQSAMGALVRAQSEATPRQVLVSLNQLLHDNIRARLVHDDHVTLTLLRYGRDGQVSFAGAHEDLLVLRQATGKVELVRTPGTWLGASRDIAEATVDSSLKLEDGDLLVLYTDGLIEGANAEGELYELERLSSALLAVRDQPVERIRDHLLAEASAWAQKQEDDITLMVMRYRTPSGASAQPGASSAKANAPSAWRFAGASRFDGAPGQEVPALAQTSRAGALSAQGQGRARLLGLRLRGVAETLDQEQLATWLAGLHAEAMARSCTEVEVDLRELRFLTSSCFKAFVTWLTRVRAEPQGSRYMVRFVSAPSIRWQRASLAALATFAPELMVQGE